MDSHLEYYNIKYNKSNLVINLKHFLSIHQKYFGQFLFGNHIFLINIHGFKFFVRPRTTDLYILNEVVEEKCYQPTLKLKGEKIKLIVDLGAHFGSFSIWANQTFQPQKIIAVEMEKDNLRLLRQNIATNGLSDKIKIIDKAIYSQSTKMKIKRHLFDTGRHQLNDSNRSQQEEVETISLAQMIKENRIKKIDFLKIDIEGAEKYLLTSQNKNVFKNRVSLVILEVHRLSKLSQDYVSQYFEKLGFKTKLKKRFRFSSFLVEAVKNS